MDKHEPPSPEEVQVTAILTEANKKIEEIEKTLKNLPPDKIWEPRPSGIPGYRPYGTRNQNIERLKLEREGLEADAIKKINKAVEVSSPEIKSRVTLAIQQWKDPVHQENLRKKDISESQEHILKIKGNQSKEKDITKANIETPTGNTVKDAVVKPMTMGARFSATLGFNRIQDKSGKDHSKTDKSGIDKERD